MKKPQHESEEGKIIRRWRLYLEEFPDAILHCDGFRFSASHSMYGEFVQRRPLGKVSTSVAMYYRLKAIMTAHAIGSGKKAA